MLHKHLMLSGISESEVGKPLRGERYRHRDTSCARIPILYTWEYTTYYLFTVYWNKLTLFFLLSILALRLFTGSWCCVAMQLLACMLALYITTSLTMSIKNAQRLYNLTKLRMTWIIKSIGCVCIFTPASYSDDFRAHSSMCRIYKRSTPLNTAGVSKHQQKA